MYNQSLVNVIEPVKKTTITRLNRGKKWKYGYNKENDIVVISKTGMIGEIYEIQNLKIALPKQPKNILLKKNMCFLEGGLLIIILFSSSSMFSNKQFINPLYSFLQIPHLFISNGPHLSKEHVENIPFSILLPVDYLRMSHFFWFRVLA